MADDRGRYGHLRREAADEVSFGRPRPRLRLPGWVSDRRVGAGVALVVVAAAVAAAVAASGHGPRRPPRAAAVTVIHVGHRLLGVRANWDLFAAGPGVLLRIRLAAGVITRTAVPPLLSSGPVYFVVGLRQAIIRPLDIVPGYLIPDGLRARPLPAALGRGGQAFPGPGPGQLWVQTGFSGRGVLSLENYLGQRLRSSITFPGPSPYLPVPDGRGYFLVQDGGVVYDVRPGRPWRVGAGTIDAAGPSAWLVTRCRHGRCRYEVIDPANGARRLVPGRAGRPATAPSGVISPNGLIAAVVRNGPGGRWSVHLINLATGAALVPRLSASNSAGLAGSTPSLAWSPDSRWLFAVTSTGSLVAIDPATGQSRGLGVALPPVSQLMIRAAG